MIIISALADPPPHHDCYVDIFACDLGLHRCHHACVHTRPETSCNVNAHVSRHTLQQREGGVQQLHLDALERRFGWLDVEKVEDDGLIWAEHAAAGHLDERRHASPCIVVPGAGGTHHRAEGVSDLTCVR